MYLRNQQQLLIGREYKTLPQPALLIRVIYLYDDIKYYYLCTDGLYRLRTSTDITIIYKMHYENN
jgi:hypothetical protein